MARAIDLARRADHRTSPNPMVGAIVLDAEGQPAGEGFHERAGTPHAEIHALRAAGDRARGGTLYVTLEPCSHAGRTGPCVEAVIAAGIRRVVVAMRDPDPQVNGAGVARLRAAGLEVDEGVGEEAARRLNEMYAVHRSLGRPFVLLKWAMTLDGRVATASGSSRWISSAESRAHAHRLRHQCDAVLVGVGTVLADDPELTARFAGARQPLRVVLDSRLRTPPTARVVGAGTLIATTVTGGDELRAKGAEVVRLPAGSTGRVDVKPLLELLARRGVLGVLVEGGPRVHAAFFEAALVDKVVAYIAPKLVGGAWAPGPVAGRGVAAMSDALRLGRVSVERAGGDIVVTGYPPSADR